VQADGIDRVQWVQIAQAWLELARMGTSDLRPSKQSS
jgi:hypothetical protein